MKTQIMFALALTLSATAASAKTYCSVTGEGKPGSYDQTRFLGEVMLTEESKEIWAAAPLRVYASRKNGETSVVIVNGASFSSLAVSDGKKVVVVDKTANIAAACVDIDQAK